MIPIAVFGRQRVNISTRIPVMIMPIAFFGHNKVENSTRILFGQKRVKNSAQMRVIMQVAVFGQKRVNRSTRISVNL